MTGSMVAEHVRTIPEPLTVAHADELFDALQAEDLYTFIPEAPPVTVSALRDRYEALIGGPGPASPERWFNWVLRERGSAEALGLLQATLREGERSASVAYLLFPAHRGCGYAREGVAQTMDTLSRHHGVERFRAEIDSRNERSLRLVTRLGFEHERDERTAVGVDRVYVKRYES